MSKSRVGFLRISRAPLERCDATTLFRCLPTPYPLFKHIIHWRPSLGLRFNTAVTPVWDPTVASGRLVSPTGGERSFTSTASRHGIAPKMG